jgi:hypothetical protein
MKKQAWPSIGTPEEPLGFLEPTSGPKDMVMDSQERYSTFAPWVSVTGEEVPGDYEENVISPVDENFTDQLDEEIQVAARKLQLKLLKNSNFLAIGNISEKVLNIISLAGINIYSLNNLKINKKSSIYNEINDSRFYNFGKEFDGFLANLSLHKDKDYILKNIFAQLKPFSTGYIISSDDISKEIEDTNFKISSSKLDHSHYIYSVLKDDLSNLSVAKICKADNTVQALIKCKTVESIEDKMAGLQVYDHLPQDSGLIFKYNKPQSVTFHMGKVAFPIDIIFIDDNYKVKKIAKNIQPGTLDLFSCTDVLNVLEINGGMADSLGIFAGDYIFINDSFNKTASEINTRISYTKRSKNLQTGIYKNAGIDYSVINKESKNYRFPEINNYIFCDFDSYFDRPIKLARMDDDGRISLSLFNDMIKISNDYINVNLLDYLNYNIFKKLENKYAFNMNDAFVVTDELSDNFKRASRSFDKIIFLSSNKISKFLVAHLLKTAFDENVPNFEIFQIPKSCNTITKKSNAISSRYRPSNTEFLISKKAGIPVPDEIKQNAKKALKLFSDSKDQCQSLVKNFQQNKNVYEKVSGNQEVIKNSKGQYQESCRRNSDILVKALIGIRDGIKIMNNIKDISYTEEVFSILADTSKAMSEGAKKIFDLIDIIDMPDFYEKLTSKTNEFNNLFEDFSNTIERMKKFINNDILGVKVLIGE